MYEKFGKLTILSHLEGWYLLPRNLYDGSPINSFLNYNIKTWVRVRAKLGCYIWPSILDVGQVWPLASWDVQAWQPASSALKGFILGKVLAHDHLLRVFHDDSGFVLWDSITSQRNGSLMELSKCFSNGYSTDRVNT